MLDDICLVSFSCFGNLLRKKIGNNLGIIVRAFSVKFIWISRNNLIFRGKIKSVEDTNNSVNFFSWRWLFVDSSVQNYSIDFPAYLVVTDLSTPYALLVNVIAY